MSANILAVLCLALVSMSQAVFADTVSKKVPLSISCKESGNNGVLAANSPIWLDVSITNDSPSIPFSGSYSLSSDYGMSVTAPAGDGKSRMEKGSVLSGFIFAFTLKPGGTKHFHVLLNELLPIIQPGVLSAHIVLPIAETLDGRSASLILVAPFSVNVESPLTQEQIQAESKLLVAKLEGTDQEKRTDAEREVKVLTDKYAVPILIRVTKDISFAPWAIDSLGSRPRTQETISALQDLAHSSNADTRSVAETYLTQN